MPSRLADDEEFAALVEVVADRQRFITFIPDPSGRQMRRDVERMAALCGSSRRACTPGSASSTTRTSPDWAPHAGLCRRNCKRRESKTYPQVSPRTLDIHVNWNGGMSWFTLEEGVASDGAGAAGAESRIVAECRVASRCPRGVGPGTPHDDLHKHPDRIRLVSVTGPENAKWVGSTLADLVAARGGHPSDVLADWLLENELQPGIVGVGVSNADPEGVGETLKHPASVTANSDAGAHLTMMCAIGDTTLTLTRHVRDRHDLFIEEAVHRMTGRIADLFGFSNRGVLTPGCRGGRDRLRAGPTGLADRRVR